MTHGRSLRPRRDAAGIAAYAVALCVHALTLALLVGGVLLLVYGWGIVMPVAGVLMLGFAWLLRPRFGRLPDDEPVLHRAEAPRLFALVDEVAAVAGTRGVDAIVVTAEVNASVTTYGVRGRRLLSIGLGLWEITTPGQRVALLGHELGHYANGDSRHGLIIAKALGSLTTWCRLLAPISSPTGWQVALTAMYLLPRWLFAGTLVLLDGLTLRAAQRGEYLADSLAAKAGSSDAAATLMDRLTVAESAETALRREANSGRIRGAGEASRTEPWQGLWKRLAAHMDSIPESEYERRRRVGALRGHSVDSTHPPTHLRRAALLAATPVAASVVTDTAAEEAIATELAPARERLARELFSGWQG
ncbi:M48 family metallopeptidase [Streptomyces montanisoli]|uniref:M48 family metallopeptidase n=1 Tax=Streptomyces montanisoli TaxID=2798581 RepID=UPI0027DD1919|nr:M48 family metallopeptidase [Streptomyces montanisoli]